ncbi:uncharacterized protein LOC126042959 [Accipiter gentilis]|uniref:uncharacterized protein LOC126042959 n=1 Tax=Astur gentilis TaxID=8957 RepID=UPI00210F4C28|nr:uncharacterized protein LOC126042959 [Accipiter gentilis]XP_049666690.1 uncharacterized protein LOC126042959 [Accipiter gentilis]XP_049666691.1 uncharacterized protein LOC126042959 [Accipiter gentilis]XP_049666692.1 uncharacterized protein LOC126042959 [Accipiter gentilis]XP_049666693.1 uncharacterized protein LOC126042959 [Accipiter gentilis]
MFLCPSLSCLCPAVHPIISCYIHLSSWLSLFPLSLPLSCSPSVFFSSVLLCISFFPPFSLYCSLALFFFLLHLSVLLLFTGFYFAISVLLWVPLSLSQFLSLSTPCLLVLSPLLFPSVFVYAVACPSFLSLCPSVLSLEILFNYLSLFSVHCYFVSVPRPPPPPPAMFFLLPVPLFFSVLAVPAPSLFHDSVVLLSSPLVFFLSICCAPCLPSPLPVLVFLSIPLVVLLICWSVSLSCCSLLFFTFSTSLSWSCHSLFLSLCPSSSLSFSFSILLSLLLLSPSLSCSLLLFFSLSLCLAFSPYFFCLCPPACFIVSHYIPLSSWLSFFPSLSSSVLLPNPFFSSSVSVL